MAVGPVEMFWLPDAGSGRKRMAFDGLIPLSWSSLLDVVLSFTRTVYFCDGQFWSPLAIMRIPGH